MAWFQWIIDIFRALFGGDDDSGQRPYSRREASQPKRPAQTNPQYRTQPRQPESGFDDNVNLLKESLTYDSRSAEQKYTALRDRARAYGDAMAQCYEDRNVARRSRDFTKATRLNLQGEKYAAEQERLDKKASEWIFKVNNKDRTPNELDLHGLYVKEAVRFTEDAIIAAQKNGYSQLRVIVGKGLHSQGGAKLRPAIEDLAAQLQLVSATDPRNAGVLILTLQRKPSQATKPRGEGKRSPEEWIW
ncbi:hypothetical protein FRB94_013623 [Tulasnella sp. JGI-2019a]|nr:hypothetical protein FRB93_007641 [Tulasnella sp. JGI-2019a]KAG9008263.1 hypothetical protein FRB94_013623 [Tulasnella sp. JGI-2019a]KAG9026870.1 hypothetical protein FRB95_008356 [Tulasnella sp. JGI-2019a]